MDSFGESTSNFYNENDIETKFIIYLFNLLFFFFVALFLFDYFSNNNLLMNQMLYNIGWERRNNFSLWVERSSPLHLFLLSIGEKISNMFFVRLFISRSCISYKIVLTIVLKLIINEIQVQLS